MKLYFALFFTLAALSQMVSGDKVIGLSCRENSWIVSSIEVKYKEAVGSRHRYEVSVVCRDRLTSRPHETKKATFVSSIDAEGTSMAGFPDQVYKAIYYRTYDLCFRSSFTPRELLAGEVYEFFNSEACPEQRQISIFTTELD